MQQKERVSIITPTQNKAQITRTHGNDEMTCYCRYKIIRLSLSQSKIQSYVGLSTATRNSCTLLRTGLQCNRTKTTTSAFHPTSSSLRWIFIIHVKSKTPRLYSRFSAGRCHWMKANVIRLCSAWRITTCCPHPCLLLPGALTNQSSPCQDYSKRGMKNLLLQHYQLFALANTDSWVWWGTW